MHSDIANLTKNIINMDIKILKINAGDCRTMIPADQIQTPV